MHNLRPIIFRGKRYDNNEWIEGDLICNDGASLPKIKFAKESGIDYDTKAVHEATVCQFVGTFEGIKVWEHDLIVFEKNIPCEVVWNAETGGFALLEIGSQCLGTSSIGSMLYEYRRKYFNFGFIADNIPNIPFK